jgi:hypothetical protein
MADIEQDLLSEGVRETENEILSEAFQDTPAQEPEPVAEPEKPENRDPETGQFKATEQKTEPEKVTQTEQEPDEHGQVPSWRVREINEEKRGALARAEAAERERSELKSRLEAMERQLQQHQKPKEEPKQEDIDPLIDPQGFAKRLETSFESKLREIQLNNNLALASVKHGEKFDAAYNAFLQAAQQGDRVSYQSVMNSPNPGEAMVRWHAQQQTLKEVGSDPAAYKQKLLDDAMKDPAFQARVIEAIKGGSVQQGQRPNNITQLPPSLSRATGSKSGSSIEDDTDGSDRAVFDYAFR